MSLSLKSLVVVVFPSPGITVDLVDLEPKKKWMDLKLIIMEPKQSRLTTVSHLEDVELVSI